MIEAIAAVRQDLGVSQWLSRVVTEFLASGEFTGHLERHRAVHRRKHDHAVESLRTNGGGLMEAEPSDGGFHLWMKLADGLDGTTAAAEAARDGVSIRSYDAFKGLPRPHHMRLGFGHLSADELDEGVRLLAAAFVRAERTEPAPA
jgi:2-aminoadipate transaminase